ncbi:MAG: CopG family antitoxin [Polynucleobacter sp.]
MNVKVIKLLKPIPIFVSSAQERAFWEVNDASEFFNLNNAVRAHFPNLKTTNASCHNAKS